MHRADVLGLDIKGYSQKAVDLISSNGPGAAEELCTLLNRGFAGIEDRLARHGFQVVDVLGDGFIAYRESTASGEDAVDRIAHSVGLEFSRATELPCRVAGVSGTLALREVGDRSEAFGFASGEAVSRLHAKMQRADIIAGNKPNRSWRTFWPPRDKPKAKVGSLADKMIRHSFGEVRWLAVLFIRLADLARAHVLDLEVLDGTVQTSQQVIEAHGGRLEKITHDDKGILLCATFQHVSQGQEALLEAALSCACELAKSIKLDGVTPRFGLSEGHVYRGMIVFGGKSVTTIMGPAANNAAKLLQRAHSTISLQASDGEQIRGYIGSMGFEWSETQLNKDTIFEFNQENFKSLAVQEARSPDRIGRRVELEMLESELEKLTLSRIRGTALVGPAGIGKSHILAEFLREAGTDATFINIRADSRRRSEPLAVFRDLMSTMLPMAAQRHGQSSTEFVDDVLNSGISAIAPRERVLASEILGPLYAEGRGGAPVDPAFAPAILERIVTTLLGAAATGPPHVIAIDDAHWLDEASWALLQKIIGTPGRIMFLLAFRDSEATTLARVRELDNREDFRLLRIEPLLPTESAELIRRISGGVGLDDADIDELTMMSGGNPLFIEQVSHHLKAGWREEHGAPGVLHDAQSTHTVRGLDSISQVLDERLDSLNSVQTEALRLLSVVDEPMTASELAGGVTAIAGCTIKSADIDALAAQAFVQMSGSEVHIRHGLLRDAVIGRTPPTRRRQCHRQAAFRLRAGHRAPTSRTRPEAAIGHHLEGAELWLPAAAAFGRAGADALSLGSYRAGLDFYQRAIGAAHRSATGNRLARCAEWHALNATIHWALGDLSAAASETQRALFAIDDFLGGPKWLQASVCKNVARARRAVLPAVGLKNLVLPKPWRRAAIATSIIRAETAYYVGDVAAILSANMTTFALANDPGTRDLARARGFAFLGYLAGIFRLDTLAISAFRTGASAGDWKSDGRPSSYALGAEAVWHLGFGRWSDANCILDLAVQRVQDPPDAQQVEVFETLRALGAYFRGDWQASVAGFEKVHSVAYARGNRLHEAWGLYGKGEALLSAGQTVQPRVLLEAAQDLLRDQPDLQSKAICLGLTAQLCFEEKLYDEALDWAKRGAEFVQSVPTNNFGSLEGFAGPVEVLLRLALTSNLQNTPDRQLNSMLARARRRLAQFAVVFPIARPRLALCNALAEQGRGRSDSAVKHLKAGLAHARRLEMRFEEQKLNRETLSLSQRFGDGDNTHGHKV